jgi:polar amino acid transport system substrate-binding protein
MKKSVFVFLAAVLILAVAFSGCAKKKEAVLRIGTNAEYPPFEYKEGAEFAGVDMDLAKAIAEKLGMKYEIIDMEFDSLIPSLAGGKVDLAISAITITEDRKGQVDFSDPYYVANQVIIAKPDTKLKIEKLEDLAKYKVGAQNGTTGQIYIDSMLVAAKKMDAKNLRKYATNIEAITDMLNGNIDFVIIDDSAAEGYGKMKPLSTVFKIETNESYGIAFPKNSELKDKVNAALGEMISSGDLVKIIQKYFGAEELTAPADTTKAE